MALVNSKQRGAPPPPQLETPSMAALQADLAAEQSSVRRAAVRGLADHPEAAVDLCDRLEVETSPSVRAVLFTTLIRLQSPEVAARLADLLRSDDVPLRNAAIEALQEMPDAVAPHFEQLLADEDSDVRIFTVNILATLRHARASEWLTDVMRSDPHVNVCAAAVDGLTEVGGLEALPDLEDLRHRFAGNAFMEFAIDAAMRRIRGE
jgi:HEAT repeat protein